MKITRGNYEAYMIDLMEGNLSAVQEEELRTFLSENPDLPFETEINDIRIPVEEAIFSFKEDIKKGGISSEINEENYGQFCIAAIEKDLSPFMGKRLEQFLAENPHLNHSASVYKHLILYPDRSIVFNEKQLIKNKRRNIFSLKKRTVYHALSVAASIALIVSSYLFISKYTGSGQFDNEPAGRQIAGREQTLVESDFPDNESDASRRELIFENNDHSNIIASNEYNQSIQGLIEKRIERKIETDHNSREPALLPLLNPRQSSIIKEVRSVIPAEPVNFVKMMTQHGATVTEFNKEKSTGRIILNGLFALVTRNIDYETENERERLKIWDVADAGLKAFNTLAGTDLYLGRDYDDNREIISLGLSSRVIEIQRLLPDEE